MDPHPPKKLIATKYCFVILWDDTTICDIRTWIIWSHWRNNVDMLCSTFFSFLLEIGQVQPTAAFQNNIGRDKDKYHSSVTQQCDPSGVSSIVVSFSLFSYFSLFMLCYFLFCYYKLLQKLFYYYYCYIKEFFSKRNNLIFACSGMFQDDLECFIDAHSTDRNWQTEKRQVRHVSSTTWFQTSGYCLAKSNLTRSV